MMAGASAGTNLAAGPVHIAFTHRENARKRPPASVAPLHLNPRAPSVEERNPMAYKAEYIWVDGTAPTAKLRSKTKILEDGVTDLPIWGFDGSSTNQAPGDKSDCVLQPVFSCPDPIRGGDNILVMSEVLYIDMTPHATNTRRRCADGRREVRRPGADLRHRAGVHVLQGRPPLRLPVRRLPRPAGRLLLRRRRRRGLRP